MTRRERFKKWLKDPETKIFLTHVGLLGMIVGVAYGTNRVVVSLNKEVIEGLQSRAEKAKSELNDLETWAYGQLTDGVEFTKTPNLPYFYLTEEEHEALGKGVGS